MPFDMIGPLLPLATTSKCCSAARHCGHSCRAQDFVGSNFGVRTKPPVAQAEFSRCELQFLSCPSRSWSRRNAATFAEAAIQQAGVQWQGVLPAVEGSHYH
jgi:hypothetical protein